ncbi:MAG: OadG family protein [Bacteroidaceae bacterium]|nr:OadG family protein [Bacteroidaceae bacterium]
MNLLSANWAEAWMITGMSILVVFCILLLIVLVLLIFNMTAKKVTATARDVKQTYQVSKQVKAFEEASEEDKAAVAIALYLFYNDDHDKESGILTINKAPSAWGRVLNPRL